MAHQIASVETFIVTMDREAPYLGPLAAGETVNARGYLVRKGNATIYPTVDRSVVVRITLENGLQGWGETYGICAPRATIEIINDLLVPNIIGRDPEEVETIWDELYGLMRVRGCSGGFYVDAIAALDIAIWDLRAQVAGLPLNRILSTDKSWRPEVPAYISGLPALTIQEKVAIALEWQAKGFDAFKFAAVVSHGGIAQEFSELRKALGQSADIMVDLHWKYRPNEALQLILELEEYAPTFIEAPVKPEDIDGLRQVAEQSSVSIAAGEEWHTEYEALHRIRSAPLRYIQPEMGHTGVTQFLRISRLATESGMLIAPHATIGCGLFLAASLHVSSILPNFWKHEFQHSIFAKNLMLLDGDMDCENGRYSVPTGTGIGVRPNENFWNFAEKVE